MASKLAGRVSALAAAVVLMAVFLAPASYADVAQVADDGSVTVVPEDAAFGLSGMKRLQTGSNKTYEGVSYGYAYILGASDAVADDLVLLATDDAIIVYVPLTVAQACGFNPEDEGDQAVLTQQLRLADDALASGGTKLSDSEAPYVFTTDAEYVDGAVTYRFDVDLDGYTYATCTVAGAESSRGVTLFCDFGVLQAADAMEAVGASTWWQDVQAFLSKLDWQPLWVSLKTASVALVFIFIFGLLAAWGTMNVHNRLRSILDTVFTIPMVLPPTVCGFILLVIFGKSSGFGRWLIEHGISLVFTWPAAVIAAVVVGFPLMYRTVLGALEAVDANMLDAARTLGWSEKRIFMRLMLPLAWPSIAAGMVLGFARAMGEFGATLFFAGNYAGVTQTMPLAIYFSWMGGSTDVAVFWAVVVIIISFIIIMIINLYSAHVQKFRKAKASGIDEDIDLEAGEMPYVDAAARLSADGEGGVR